MIDLYYWPTPNGHKITIFLEETGLAYRIRPVDISKGDQFKPDFLAISPNNRMPAIVDREPADGGAAVTFSNPARSCSISPKRPDAFSRPTFMGARARCNGSFGRWAGSAPWRARTTISPNTLPRKIPYAMERYRNETGRLYGVMDGQLAKTPFLAGDYSIADIACYPWIVPYEDQGQDLDDFPHLKRWFDAIRARPAVIRAYAAGAPYERARLISRRWSAKFFGQTAARDAAK